MAAKLNRGVLCPAFLEEIGPGVVSEPIRTKRSSIHRRVQPKLFLHPERNGDPHGRIETWE